MYAIQEESAQTSQFPINGRAHRLSGKVGFDSVRESSLGWKFGRTKSHHQIRPDPFTFFSPICIKWHTPRRHSPLAPLHCDLDTDTFMSVVVPCMMRLNQPMSCAYEHPQSIRNQHRQQSAQLTSRLLTCQASDKTALITPFLLSQPSRL